VINLIGFTQNPNTIIMPLYLGDLSIRITHRYSFGDVLAMVQQLITGIKAIHSNGVAHRDFKPKNVLLSARGNKARKSSEIAELAYILKITDFGVCYLDTNEKADIHGLKIRSWSEKNNQKIIIHNLLGS